MLALLSSPVRRWLLAAVLLPVLVWVLAKAGQFLERRNGGESTTLSRLLSKSSSALTRLTKGSRDSAGDAPSHDSADVKTASPRNMNTPA